MFKIYIQLQLSSAIYFLKERKVFSLWRPTFSPPKNPAGLRYAPKGLKSGSKIRRGGQKVLANWNSLVISINKYISLLKQAVRH